MPAKTFSALETNILKAKGVNAAQLKKLASAGVKCRDDFRTVGDAATLAQLAGLDAEVAAQVMAWAVGAPDAPRAPGNVVVESGDVVSCVHCKARQPKDYKSGDLCPACGKQAEPILACYWCAASGPGKFCRQCGAEFVPTGEYELAVQLRRDGLAKDAIPPRLKALTAEEKDALWGRIRKHRG